MIDRAGAVRGSRRVYNLCLSRLIATGILVGWRPPEHVAASLPGRGLAARCARLLGRCCETQSEVGADVIKSGGYCVKLQKLMVRNC